MTPIGEKQGEKDGPSARNSQDDRFFVKWLEKQPESTQTEYVHHCCSTNISNLATS